MKYHAWFCHCGRIQIMPGKYYDWLAEDANKRRIIQVCQNCGHTYVTWLSDFEDGYAVNGASLKNVEIMENDGIERRFIFNRGIRVPLKNSWKDAVGYCGGKWFDDEGVKEVDTKQLIKDVKDEEILTSISGYVSGIDWSGTKYER